MLAGKTQSALLFKSYPVVVQKILNYLNDLDHKTLPIGRHELPGFEPHQAWFVILEYNKEPLGNLKPEVHKYHSDLQIMLEGSEMMAWSVDSGNHINAEPYNASRDLQYYQSEGIELNFIQAKPKQFYLFTPDIVHITNIEDGNEQPVRKLVVKIHNDLLEA